MRAVEQAWKAERARQAELEADAQDEARERAEALRQAEELEAKRPADQRIRVALDRAKRFRARAITDVTPRTRALGRSRLRSPAPQNFR